MRLVVHFHSSFPASYPSNLIYNYFLSQVILTLIILVFRNNSLDCAAKNKQNLSTSSSALNPHLHSIRVMKKTHCERTKKKAVWSLNVLSQGGSELFKLGRREHKSGRRIKFNDSDHHSYCHCSMLSSSQCDVTRYRKIRLLVAEETWEGKGETLAIMLHFWYRNLKKSH